MNARMNLWTFLDRNSGEIIFLSVIACCFAFGTCGGHRGCRVQCGTGSVEVSAPDSGAP